jgi:hypothetical protein
VFEILHSINSKSSNIDAIQSQGQGAPTQAELNLSSEILKLLRKYAPEAGIAESHYLPRMRGGKVLGVYYPKTNNIYLGALQKIGTAIHEITHAIDEKTGFINSIKNGKQFQDIRDQLEQVFLEQYAGADNKQPLKHKIEEGLATLIELSITNPKLVAENYSLAFDYMMSNKVFADFTKEAKGIVEKYQGLSALGKVEARMYDAEKKEALALKKKPFLTKGERIIYETINKYFWAEKIDKLSGNFDKDSVNNWVNIHPHIPGAFHTDE